MQLRYNPCKDLIHHWKFAKYHSPSYTGRGQLSVPDDGLAFFGKIRKVVSISFLFLIPDLVLSLKVF